jgi:hypothetical protein
MAVRTVADVFGVNFFPGGGAGYQMHPDETANTLAMLRLMRKAGVRHVRWWINSPGSVELFAQHGITLLPSSEHAEQTRHGVWLVHTRNEPDFANVLPEAMASEIRGRRKIMNADDPASLLAAPEIGGDLAGPGSEYLRDVYRAGARDFFQVMSIHPYVKTSCETPRGGIPCCPESLPDAIRALRAAMCEFGDVRKPIMATECIGYGTYEGAEHYPWIPPVTSERQAAWLVRSHVLLVAVGLARIYHYPFQDEGTDRTQITHNAGLVDWHGKPKHAYHVYSAMTSLLGPTRSDGLQADARPPVFGARFTRPEGGFVTALWDCGGTSRVAIETTAGVSGMKFLAEEHSPVHSIVGTQLIFTVGENPVWISSSRPLAIVSQDRLEPPLSPQLHVRLTPAAVRVRPGGTTEVAVIIKHDFSVPQQVLAEVQSPWNGSEKFSRSLTAPPGKEVIMSISIPCPATAQRNRIHSWGVVCRYGPEGQKLKRTEERHFYIMVPP